MAQPGGQPGNTNAANKGAFVAALRHELAAVGRKLRDDRKKQGKPEPGDDDGALTIGIRHMGKKWIEAAMDGEPLSTAIKEMADRFDGKPVAAIELGGPDGGPIQAVDWALLPVTPIDRADGESVDEPGDDEADNQVADKQALPES